MSVDTSVSLQPSSAQQPSRRLFLIWQHPQTRRFSPVGALIRAADGDFVFRYVGKARTLDGFRPLAAFPDINQEYRSAELPAFFENRVMSSRRPEYVDLLDALDLPIEQATPLELLARTGGGRATDKFNLVAEPEVTSDGRLVSYFLVHGIRHIEGAEERVRTLRRGHVLHLRPETSNPVNHRALLIDESAGSPVGYVPDWMVELVHELLDHDPQLRLTVEQVNGPDVPYHLRLLCRLDAKPSGDYRPFAEPDLEFV